MSHIVTIRTGVRDHAAVGAACRRLELPPPIPGTAELFSGQATGLIVRLPEWTYPIVIDSCRVGTAHQESAMTAPGGRCPPYGGDVDTR